MKLPGRREVNGALVVAALAWPQTLAPATRK